MPLVEGLTAFEFGTRRDCCLFAFSTPAGPVKVLAVWDLSVLARVAPFIWNFRHGRCCRPRYPS
ncbi:MAG: hypothetical protein ORN25_01135 [Caulobacteraceae bacterium]|nr:hypothetical protein [Caulobacteraceae bacterium]